MRKLLLLTASFIVTMQVASAIAGPMDDCYGELESLHRLADWDWGDGLLGDSIEGDVHTDDGTIYPGFFCIECRDPGQYPRDFAAFAYNGYFGENPWMLGSKLGIPFRIYNPGLQWVTVWFEDFLFDKLSLLPETMLIYVRLQNGEIISFRVLQDGPDMPVGE